MKVFQERSFPVILFVLQSLTFTHTYCMIFLWFAFYQLQLLKSDGSETYIFAIKKSRSSFQDHNWSIRLPDIRSSPNYYWVWTGYLIGPDIKQAGIPALVPVHIQYIRQKPATECDIHSDTQYLGRYPVEYVIFGQISGRISNVWADIRSDT